MRQDSTSSEFEKRLDDHSRSLDLSLSHLFESSRLGARQYHPFVADLYDSIFEFALRPGKRIASFTTALVCEGYGLARGPALRAVLEAIELYRHSILIHDDLVDQDESRRGGPTLMRKYAGIRDERLGVGCSVFSGNILLSMSLSRILNSPIARDDALSALKEVVSAYVDVNESQTLDLAMEGEDVAPEEWATMASKRAASLFRTTLRIGGILCHAEKDLDLLGRAGEEMGYVFDIQDDIIDTFASAEEYGRKPGSDLAKGKRPLHIVLAMQEASPTQREILTSPLADMASVRKTLLDTGAVEKAKSFAEEHSSRCLSLLSRTRMSNEGKEAFRSLIRYMAASLSWYV